jgi:hypothetical protein
MQNRYTGDIGDFGKYSLLNHLSNGMQLGVAWYLNPDEGHNNDGKYISYLSKPDEWRIYDPVVFDGLKRLVHNGIRSTLAVQQSGILQARNYSAQPLDFIDKSYQKRAKWRRDWFRKTLGDLDGCSIVFADPDNGLCGDAKYKYHNVKEWKRLPLDEVCELAKDRTAVLYHHNTRRAGGHEKEIRDWMDVLLQMDVVSDSCAVRFRAGSSRTFFIVNGSKDICKRAEQWCKFFPKADFFSQQA